MQPITEIQQDVLELYRVGQYDQALDMLRPVLTVYPDEGRLWELCGLIHRAMSDCPPCLHALETATTLVPLSFTAQCALADCYVHTDRTELASDIYSHLKKQIKRLPVDLLKNLAIGFESLGDIESALEVSREAAFLEPTSAEHRYATAYFMAQMGLPTESVVDWAQEAVRLDPDRAQYRIGLSGLMQTAGRIDEAYECVSVLTQQELKTVPCGKCLERLAQLFQMLEDASREATCRSEIKRRIDHGELEDCGGC